MTSRSRVVGLALGVALGAGALTGCNASGGAAPATTARPTSTTLGPGAPIDADQANRVAGALFLNGDRGGASITVTAPFSPNLTAHLVGTIDWKQVVGHVTLQLTGVGAGESSSSTGQTLNLWWTKTAVIEETPGLGDAMAKAGLPPLPYDTRSPQPTTVQADRLLAIITGLASGQRDNPLLLLQGGKATFLRTDQVAGHPVEVFRFNTTSRLWIDTDDGLLRRFELDVSGYAGPVVIDLADHGPRTVALPPGDQVVDVREIPSIYRSVTGR